MMLPEEQAEQIRVVKWSGDDMPLTTYKLLLLKITKKSKPGSCYFFCFVLICCHFVVILF
jgi:hypothetical protein